ncbi:DNA adenine methylase [Agrobacterium salinitolerans]|uniref:DNA adenine methylase n=1 Tax=Agrobacterium salinitolerans TaxID=1183413 RepID=A0A9X3KP59_9HYPH|nr:DNA adenine methylase [Agrobacterium salinitolerans]MCZ7938478.1 DNA adenine methylase [Agrobacterium salinitolerans]
MSPTRPAMRWHGGKWLLAPWIISHFPDHRTYVEPFGGAASVLLRKHKSYAEVYNDLDDEAVNLFRVMRSDRAGELVEALRLTPFARTEFALAYEKHDDPVERARRLVTRSFLGFGGDAVKNRTTGFRNDSNRSGGAPAKDWENYPDCLPALIERLRGVVIESRPAEYVIGKFDGPETLFYVDPPYVHSSRDLGGNGKLPRHTYEFEMTDHDHVRLLEQLRAVEGMVVLSGYASELYDDALSDWKRVTRTTLADGARTRTEVLWVNPAGRDRLDAIQIPLLIEGVA